ncbi:MAG TPA: sigma factor-like helix-turn-helix DNA-binding protein [Terriglobales bacterium]|nr:sigma factor-like helix-turn-helix DNA-binding protein [Terriglobales bacterium]
MNVHISYKVQKTPDIEKETNHQIEKLSKRLQVFRPELIHLKGIMEENSAREGFVVSLNLRLPSGQMAVQKASPNPTAAIKASFDDLLQQITKHKDLLRASHKWKGRRRTMDGRPAKTVPFEETVAAVQPTLISSEDVRSYVNANLKRLELFVERELYFRQASDQLPEDSVTKEEVIDEVILRALSDGDKPERLALEPWLYRLAIRSMNDLANNSREFSSQVNLDASTRRQNVRGSDESELQYHQPDETLNQESTIPDTRVSTPEQVAYTDEMITMFEASMSGMPAEQREAFILYGIEGFSIPEIAAIVDRDPEKVRASIISAREYVRKSAFVTNEFRDKVLQKTGSL